jgi:hypothetical protein
MNDRAEVEMKTESTRKFEGRIIFWTELVVSICGVILGFAMPLFVMGFGLTTTPSTYLTPNLITLVGLLTLLIGVLIRYATNTFSKDGLWSLQTGPYIK